MPGIFISHADSVLAVALDRIVRKALNNGVTIFNSSRTATGLGAGQPIDSTLLEHIRLCDVFVWLTSPESAKQSFWMAWELGAAEALGRPIFPCRALGIEPTSLPLLQNRRYVPDLGDREDLAQFLQDLATAVGVQDTSIAETLDPFYVHNPVATPFDAALVPEDVLEITVAGKRLVIENRSDSEVRQLRFEAASSGAAKAENGSPSPVSASLLAALRTHHELGPNDRRLVSLRDSDSALAGLEHSSLIARWVDASSGRRAQPVEVRLHR